MTSTFASPRWLLVLAAAMLATLVLFVACGGGDDLGSRDNDPTATEEQNGGDDGEATPDEGEPTPDEGGDDDGGDSEFDVCALVSEEEVADITGFDITGSTSDDFDPFFGCTYDYDFGNISLSVYRDDRDVVETFYELTSDAEEVDGVGDRAQFIELFDQLEVLDGNYDITVSVFSFDSESEVDTLELDKELALLLLDRLP